MDGSDELHRTLARQLRRLGLGPADVPTLEGWQALLGRVSTSYAEADDERYTLERAIEISSSEMQQLHVLLARRARTDELTGLLNRAALVDDLSAALSYAPGAPELGVLFIDLDRFKEVNDRHGHATGDELLVQVASRLRACVRQGDVVARYGGDEFVAILHGLTTPAVARSIGERIVEAVGADFVLSGGISVSIGASVGAASAVGTDVAQLMQHADAAMYHAKVNGRGQVVAFAEGMTGPPSSASHLRLAG